MTEPVPADEPVFGVGAMTQAESDAAKWRHVESGALAAVVQFRIKLGWGAKLGTEPRVVLTDGRGTEVEVTAEALLESLQRRLMGGNIDDLPWYFDDASLIQSLPIGYSWGDVI